MVVEQALMVCRFFYAFLVPFIRVRAVITLEDYLFGLQHLIPEGYIKVSSETK